MELLYGQSLDLNRGLLTPYAKPTENLTSWVLNQIHSQQVAIQVAIDHQRRTDSHHIAAAYKSDPKGKKYGPELVFPPGSYVIVEMENGSKSKLHPILRGPMKVLSMVPGRRNMPPVYKCEDLITHNIEEFHIKQLKPFVYDTNYVDPRAVATTDTQVFDVESVLAYEFRGTERNKSNLWFKIKWEGYPDPTFEPLKNVQNTDVVVEFMRKNRLQKYIPDKFKSKLK
jgi:hypothetical protein